MIRCSRLVIHPSARKLVQYELAETNQPTFEISLANEVGAEELHIISEDKKTSFMVFNIWPDGQKKVLMLECTIGKGATYDTIKASVCNRK